MHLSLHHKFEADELSRQSHHDAHNGSVVWRLTLTVLIVTNSLLLFFLYLYDVI